MLVAEHSSLSTGALLPKLGPFTHPVYIKHWCGGRSGWGCRNKEMPRQESYCSKGSGSPRWSPWPHWLHHGRYEVLGSPSRGQPEVLLRSAAPAHQELDTCTPLNSYTFIPFPWSWSLSTWYNYSLQACLFFSTRLPAPSDEDPSPVHLHILHNTQQRASPTVGLSLYLLKETCLFSRHQKLKPITF